MLRLLWNCGQITYYNRGMKLKTGTKEIAFLQYMWRNFNNKAAQESFIFIAWNIFIDLFYINLLSTRDLVICVRKRTVIWISKSALIFSGHSWQTQFLAMASIDNTFINLLLFPIYYCPAFRLLYGLVLFYFVVFLPLNTTPRVKTIKMSFLKLYKIEFRCHYPRCVWNRIVYHVQTNSTTKNPVLCNYRIVAIKFAKTWCSEHKEYTVRTLASCVSVNI